MKKYIAYSIDKDGKRNEIEAESIVIALSVEQEIEIILNPHENFSAGLPIVTPANDSISNMENSHSVFNIRPGASNVLHLNIEKIKGK